GEGRLVALPLRLRADLQDRLAGRVDAELGAVVHLQAEDVVVLVRTGADDLGEARQADPDQLALRPELLLLPPELAVADRVEREGHRRVVVARVVLEPGR